jgi:MFS family permease
MTSTADIASRAPQTIGSRMALLLAFVSGAAVANVYYAQPLLDDLGSQLQMSPAALGWVTTATQGGYLVGLVMVVPLGDRFDRRRIILAQLAPPWHPRHGRSWSSPHSSAPHRRWFR